MATFNLTSLPVGTYHVQVGDAASSATSSGAFQVNANPAGQIAVNLALPQSTTAGTAATGTVTYNNTGATDIAAPVLDVSSTQALLDGPDNTTGSGTIEFLGTNPNGPAGILQPGASGTYTFTLRPDPAHGPRRRIDLGWQRSTRRDDRLGRPTKRLCNQPPSMLPIGITSTPS